VENIMAMVGEVFDFTITDSSLIGLLHKINRFTDVGFGGVFGIFILLVVGGVLFLMMRTYGNERAFPVAMLVVGIIGLFLRIIALVGDNVFWICIALLIVSVLLLFKEQGQYE